MFPFDMFFAIHSCGLVQSVALNSDIFCSSSWRFSRPYGLWPWPLAPKRFIINRGDLVSALSTALPKIQPKFQIPYYHDTFVIIKWSEVEKSQITISIPNDTKFVMIKENGQQLAFSDVPLRRTDSGTQSMGNKHVQIRYYWWCYLG